MELVKALIEFIKEKLFDAIIGIVSFLIVFFFLRLLVVSLWQFAKWSPSGAVAIILSVMCMGVIAWIVDLLKLVPRAFSYFALFNIFSFIFGSKDR